MKERDELWNLLGEAPLEEPPAWFVTRTLARVRRERNTAPPWVVFLKRWAWVVSTSAALLSFGLFGWEQRQAQSLAKTNAALEFIASIDTTETESWFASSY